MTEQQRADQLLLEQGLADSLEEARRLVMAGKVRCRGQMVFQPSQLVSSGEQLTLIPDPPFVSRGGEKLQAAFERFPIMVEGMVCADVGASTGGFTDCLLQKGAAHVYAIDVGYGLLDWRLRNHPRVTVLERTNARTLENLPEKVGFITADVSFISLKKIFPALAAWYLPDGGEAVVLIKPQFEADREESARGAGVIQDPEIHRRVLGDVLRSAASSGFHPRGLIRSPLQGPAGNREFLAWLTCCQVGGEPLDLTSNIDSLF